MAFVVRKNLTFKIPKALVLLKNNSLKNEKSFFDLKHSLFYDLIIWVILS
jgi:hypothetical protein